MSLTQGSQATQIKGKKVSIIGAGAVGATCADNIARTNLAKEVVLLDIKEGLAEGKAIDMMQAATLLGFHTKVSGCTADTDKNAAKYQKTADSDIVVITSGIPRKPGMTREELIDINAGIVTGVVANVLKHSKDAILIIISNPMDTMTYLTVKEIGQEHKHRVIGMGGALDSARFNYYLNQGLEKLQTGGVSNEIQLSNAQGLHAVKGMVVGGHGDTTMIPLTRLATYQDQPISEHIDSGDKQTATEKDQTKMLESIAKETMVGGATLTGLIGTSAWYAPGAACCAMVSAILSDSKRVFPCSVYLDESYGKEEYKETDICMGVPVSLGKNGWEKLSAEQLTAYELNETEQRLFKASADAVRSMNQQLSAKAS